MNTAFSTRMRPVRDLAADKPHGERLRYMAGCRCVPCRAANSRYETERAAARRRGEWNGLVDAAPVREHLNELSRRGIGRDTVSDVTGLAPSSLDLYRTGKRLKIRAMNAKKILAISPDDVLTDAQLVPAKPTWKQIQWLMSVGFTKTEIARRLGYKTHALQIKSRGLITARNAAKVERLYNKMRPAARSGSLKALDAVVMDKYVDLCTRCPLPDCIETSPECLIQIERRTVGPQAASLPA